MCGSVNSYAPLSIKFDDIETLIQQQVLVEGADLPLGMADLDLEHP
jgi:hypothetical protein